MKRDFEGGRWVVELRPQGIGRFFIAGFLAFWLAGWAVGEGFACFMLTGMLGLWPGKGMPAAPSGMAANAILGFLLVWLAFWTLGGILALTEVLSLLWGGDRIEFDGAGVRHMRRIGPFRGSRWHPRENIRGVGIRARRGALVLDTRRGVVSLTKLGTDEDRALLRKELETTLGLAGSRAGAELPAGWESDITPEGQTVLRRSRSLRELRLRAGQAERHWRLGPWAWTRVFVPAHVAVEHEVDSDGDHIYRLAIRGAAGKTTLDRTLQDPFDLVRLGHWVAEKLNTGLALPAHLQHPEDRKAS